MYDLIIVGAGPAGLTSALYASRAGVKTLILERGAPGGKVFTTHLVENYPGLESITGRDLSMQMHKHALKFGAVYEYGDVEAITKKADTFIVKTNMQEYSGKKVILATGTENRKLGVQGEEEFLGKGVSYCAVCDGNFFKNQDVAVVGGGNSALEEALYLADLCKSVTIIHRREEFRAEQYIIDKLKGKENIKYELNAQVQEIVGEQKVQSVKLKYKDKTTKELAISGIFIYVGLIPLTQRFQNFNIYNEGKNIKVDKKMATEIEGLYSAGDVNVKSLRQIATAVNDGAQAAQSVIEALK
ncbi:MAG: thioredoxin-disulfide reductase [Mycoplasmatales bacterium]